MNVRKLVPAILSSFILSTSVSAKRPHTADGVIAVKMQGDARHLMISLRCRINGEKVERACVIDSGATHTIISDRLVKAEGPLIDVTTANGVIQVHEREVSLRLADGLELKSKAFVQSNMMPSDEDVLVGQDVLRQFRAVIFDYEKGQVEFHH